MSNQQNNTVFEITFHRHLELLNEKIQPKALISETKIENLSQDTAEVGESGLEFLKETVAGLNKKATKWGLPPLELKILGSTMVDAVDATGGKLGYKVKQYTISISGESPRVTGYEFIAKLEHTENGNIINIAPNAKNKYLPPDFKTANSKCDICKSNRERYNTFVLRKLENGEYIQAGSTCLKRFLPSTSVETFIQYARLLEDLRNIYKDPALKDPEFDGDSERGRNLKYFPVEAMIDAVCAVYLLEKRFISKKKAIEQGTSSTAETALNSLFIKNPHDEWKIKFDEMRQSNECIKLKSDVLSWAKSFDFTAKADQNPDLLSYFHNLEVLSKSDHASFKNFPYVAGIVGTYLREKNHTLSTANSNPSEYVGDVGSKIEIPSATLLRVNSYDSQYGTVFIYSFKDKAGNNLVWFSSGDIGLEAEKEYKLKATVKAHQVSKYTHQKETIITRAKVQSLDGTKINENK
jgi:hypothetical protein